MSIQTDNCDHLWRTIREPSGWVSTCEFCGARQTAEHSETCHGYYKAEKCTCGATKEFTDYEAKRIYAD